MMIKVARKVKSVSLSERKAKIIEDLFKRDPFITIKRVRDISGISHKFVKRIM